MILAESPRRQRVTRLVNWGHWFALANIAIAMIIASVFIFSSPAPGTLLGALYLVCNWFGHIGFMTFSGFVIFVLPLCYLATNPRIIKLAASAIAAVGLALMAFDALLFNRTGFHLSFSSADLLRSEANTQVTEFGLQQWMYLLLLFVVWLGFQLILANAIWKRVERLQQHKIGTKVMVFFLGCFVASHAIHVWADAELYQPIVKQDNMFPLSYPATAKTTMSRYGLLDLDRYRERQQLQFDPEIHQVAYPTEPVYCNIESTRTFALVVQTDDAPLPDLPQFDLREMDNYFTTASSLDGLIHTTLFGVPEIYQGTLKDKRPVLLALPVGLGMPVSIHVDETLPTEALNGYRQPVSNNHDGLHIAFLPAAKIAEMLNNEVFANSDVIIATGFDTDGGTSRGKLYTTLNVKGKLASTEDLAPTIMNALGCHAPVQFYSSGQNLLAPQRNWLVSTSGEKVIVVHNDQMIEVLSNGSFEISDVDTRARSNDPLNVDLLSRAIKHLIHFSK
ncbi:DUF3413 domain-containing protein [Alteromonas confluentis]|uniref:Hydrolase n=1 Tax=Alteromonas confluentis TaxID=1656094 RepID=A0A1E7ZDW5_9ALTE|nr:DUF3413 domain-containing protein [Alteromonas confluentis]OFC71707.1 hydrolase [Alteromonas confluentis]